MNPRTLPARHGLLWLLAAWRLLRRYPRQMTSITLVYFLVVLTVNLIPFVGPFLMPLALPMLTALLGNACRALDNDQPLTQDILSAGLEAQRANLLRLGGLHLLGSVILLLASQPLMIELNPDQSKAEEASARLQMEQMDKQTQDRIDLAKIQSNEKIANERIMAMLQKGAQNASQIRKQ